MNKPKPFAKLFEHPTLGQLLVQRDSDDDDTPGIRITFDTGLEELDLCFVFLKVGGVDDDAANQAADQIFQKFDEAMTIASVENQIEQILRAFGPRH